MGTPTCCQFYGISDCRQGLDCPARQAADDSAHVRYQPAEQKPVDLSRELIDAMDETMESAHEAL